MTSRLNMAIVERARIILTAARGGELAQKLHQIGLDVTLLHQGQDLYARCDQTYRAASEAYAARSECTAVVQKKGHAVRTHYKKLAQTARAIYKRDRVMLQRLGLTTLRRILPPTAADTSAQDTGGQTEIKTIRRDTAAQAIFLSSARHLYDMSLQHPEILAELAKVGYPAERLQQERDELTALEVFDVEQERLKGVARTCTAAHNAAIADLQAWLSRFTGVIQPALSDRPDMLTSMGLKPRGRKLAS